MTDLHERARLRAVWAGRELEKFLRHWNPTDEADLRRRRKLEGDLDLARLDLAHAAPRG